MRIWFFVVIVTLAAALVVVAFEASEIKKINCPVTYRICT